MPQKLLDAVCAKRSISTSGSLVQAQQAQPTMIEHNEADALKLAQPTRPQEFHWITTVPFTSLFLALAIALAVLFTKSLPNGKYDV